MPSGTFRVLPALPADVLAEALRHKVLTYLCAEGRLDPVLARRMCQWHHSGFSVHNQVCVKANWARLIQKVYEVEPRFAIITISVRPCTSTLKGHTVAATGSARHDGMCHRGRYSREKKPPALYTLILRSSVAVAEVASVTCTMKLAVRSANLRKELEQAVQDSDSDFVETLIVQFKASSDQWLWTG